jgi:hypothetical protein
MPNRDKDAVDPTSEDEQVPPEVRAEWDAWLDDYAAALDEALDQHFGVEKSEASSRREKQVARLAVSKKTRGS